MIYININISNRFTLQTEDPSIAISKVIVDFENQFISAKWDINKVFN